VGAGFIRVGRARAAMQLVGEVHELGATTEPGRQYLLQGLLELVGCAIGGAVHDTGYALGLKGGIAEATLAGFDREIVDLFQAHHTHGSEFNPFHGAVMRRPEVLAGGVFTSTNGELVSCTDWNRSAWINDYARPARVDHFLCTLRRVGETSGIGAGFMRMAHDRPFTDEDREVLHLVHLGVGAFYDVASPRHRLTPRMRDTLDELLTGASDKEIAARLEISPHTVRQYVKAILRAHGVASRGQLIAAAKRV